MNVAAGGLGGLAFLFFVLWLMARSARSGLAGRLAKTEAQLSALKSRPVEKEFRIESYNVLWYPVVRAAAGAAPAVNVGLPHCPKCVRALKAGQGTADWTCAACPYTCPHSVTDNAVTDQIAKTALRYFSERAAAAPKP